MHREKWWGDGCQGLEGVNGELESDGHRAAISEDEKVLEVDRGDGCLTL